MTGQQIKILDLSRQYQQIESTLESSVLSVLRSGNYILGPYLKELEAQVAALCHRTHGIGVANGTDALILALWALGVGQGDEVVTTPFTFAATIEAIALRGATPVFVDIDEHTFNINPALIEPALTRRTKVILPVHLYGQPADMDPILALARTRGLKVVEDNAQAIGALYKGRATGSLSDLASISFYPTKNLGAAGDAGMLVTSDEGLNERLRLLRAHGARERYFHDQVGVNSRLDEIQAAVLLAKLPHLSQWNTKRRQIARWYDELLRGCPLLHTPKILPGSEHVFHQYTVRIENHSSGDRTLRDQVKAALSERGIASMCYYPVPLHLQKAFSSYGFKKSDFPVAEKVAGEVLSLPMYPELTREEVELVSTALIEILAGSRFSVAVAQPSVHAL